MLGDIVGMKLMYQSRDTDHNVSSSEIASSSLIVSIPVSCGVLIFLSLLNRLIIQKKPTRLCCMKMKI